MAYSILVYICKDIIPNNIIINGYIYLLAVYFIYPYLARYIIIKQSKQQIKFDNVITVITNSLFVKSAISIYLPFHKSPFYAVSEKTYQNITETDLLNVLSHEKAHIIYKDQKNNIIFFFSIIYMSPIIFTYISSFQVIRSYLWAYIFLAVTIYFCLFAFYFHKTRKKEFRADQYAASISNPVSMIQTLKKLHKISEVKENTFNVMATHPSCKKRIKKLEDL